MEITLNHTIVPSHNNVESARFYERILGFEFVKEWGHFAVVKVNSTFTLDFDTDENFSTLHFAFSQKLMGHLIQITVGAALTLKIPMAMS